MDIDRLKFKPDKFCGICGDKALGYNFNAITCEACKAFFRRNALRSKDFKCPFDGNCKIDLVTRRFCQKCRLKKCFDIGMKKEWILSDEEKKIKRDKIIENRKKKESNVNGFNGGNGCSSGLMIHSQLSNTSDNNTSSSSTNNGPTILTKSNDCLTIDNDGFMISSVINASVCPTLTFPSSCYPTNDDDGHNHHDHNNQNDRNRNNRPHMNHPLNHNNVDKDFLNSIYLLEQQQQHHQHKTTNTNNYLSNKFFPVRELSPSSITDDCSPSPPIIHHSTNSSISPLPSTTPSSNISSSSSLQSSYLKPTLYNNTNVASSCNNNLHHSGHLSSLLLNSNNNNSNNIDLPPLPPSSKQSHHNHNHHNHLLNNLHQNDDPNTNDYLDCKPNINLIKQLSNSHSHVQAYPNPNTTPLGLGHPIDSSTSSSSSYSPIVQKLTFKTEPIQEEIVVCTSSSRQQQQQQQHQNEFGLTFQPSPHQSHHPSHRGVGCSDVPAISFGNNHINGRINQNRILMSDQSSRISSDESETTVYNSYNSDQINYDDATGLERTVPIPPNSDNTNKQPSMEDETKNLVAQLVNVENEQSFNKMNMEDNHLNNHEIESNLKTTSKQSTTTNSTSIILQDIASLPFGPKSIGYNFVEIIRMEELTYACGHLQNWYHHGPILNEIHHLAEIYQIAEQVIHHFISMAKMINSFCELCETDQISLLKYSVTELIILRSVPCFLSNKDAWIFNLKRNEKGTILKFKTCKSQIPASEFNDDIKRFIMSIPDTCKNDQSLFDLATMVILFNPNRLELKHKEIIKLEYMTYRHLLSKYINVNYSSSSTQESKNNRIFSETILNIIDRLRKVNDKIKNRLSFKVIEEYKAKLTQL